MIFGFDISISNYLVFRLSRKKPQGIRLLFALKIRLEEGEQMDIKSPVVITDWTEDLGLRGGSFR